MSEERAASGRKGPGEAARKAARLAASFGFEAVEPARKAHRVQAVFTSVASRYDLMNDLMSGGVHRLWKEALIDWLAPRPGMHLLDLAGGTGDVATRVLNRTSGKVRVTLLDQNLAMLEAGRDRALDAGWLEEIAWIAGDAQSLPLKDRTLDAVTIAFGIRNVTEIEKALAEARRVLRPGGRFLCLEFSKLTLPLLEPLYDAYSLRVLPRIGKVVAGDAASYRYLAESIRRFPDQESLSALMREAGFARVAYRNLTGGVAAIHSGWRL